MNLLGCECQADWMNSGHKSQTSTMTLFIQTWPPECRLTLWVINFHRPRTSASSKLIPRRKMHPGKCSWAAKAANVFIPRLRIIQLIRLVDDWHAHPEVLFKSSAFCYAVVRWERNKGKNEQRPLWWSIRFQYYAPKWCSLSRDLYGKEQGSDTGMFLVPLHQKPKVTKSKTKSNSVLRAASPTILTSWCSQALNSYSDACRETQLVLRALK